MNYPSQVEQYDPSTEFAEFLSWLQKRNIFRELEPNTQAIICIAQQPLPFEELFFKIMLFRIWNDMEIWLSFEDTSVLYFDFEKAVASIPSKKRIKRKVMPLAWTKAGWSPKTIHTDAEFHFLSLEKMMRENLPEKIKEEARTLSDVVKLMKDYPGLTAALLPSLAIDLRFTSFLNAPYDNFLAFSTQTTDAIASCFKAHEKKYINVINDVWAALDDCCQQITGTPAPTLEGRPLSLQNLQWAFHDWYKKLPEAEHITTDYVLPEWWAQKEVPPERREVEILEDIPAPPFKYITQLEDLYEVLEDISLEGNLAADIETYYPNPRITKDGRRAAVSVKLITNRFKSKIRLLQLYRDGAEFVWLIDIMKLGPGFVDTVECEVLREIFKQKTIVGHNIVCFDLPWMWEHLKLRTDSILDTYVAHRILTNGIWDMKNDLKTCFKDIGLYLPKDSGSSDWGITELTERQISYAAHDVRHMHKLMAHYEESIDDPIYDLRTTWNLECALCPIVVDLTNRGNPVNLERLPVIQADAEIRLAEAQKAALDFLGDQKVNLNAPVQLLKALQKKGYRGHSTQEKYMTLDGGEGPRLVIAYKHIKNRELKFLKIVEEAVRPDGRVHSIYDQLGTVTGRFSSKDPNSQNFPRPNKKKKDSSVRSLFQAPSGHKLIIADFSQMELVIAACVVNEPSMLSALHAKEDLHKKFAATVQGISSDEVDDTGRNLGKSCNFGLLYGQSACGGSADYPDGGLRGFARNKYGVQLSVEQAEEYRAKWFEMFPAFEEFHAQCWYEARAILENGGGQIRTRGINRLQYFWEDKDKDGNVVRPLLLHAVFSSLANTPVQGTSAEIFKLVMIHLTEEVDYAEIVNVVHDEIILLASDAEAERTKEAVERIMIDATHEIFPGAPMRAEVHAVQSWAEK